MRRPSNSAIVYDRLRTPIGLCGVLVGRRGLTRVVLPVGGARALERALRRLAPGARRDRRRCRKAAAAVARFFRTGRARDAGRLDLSRATSLERSVYALLRRTRPGALLTYSEVAARLGRPRAARAVGRALARNPLPLVVPCHRVIRRDGSPGGFSCHGGVRVKRRLILLERTYFVDTIPISCNYAT